MSDSIDRPLAPCPSCHRHVADEQACPFCGAALAVAPIVKSTLPGRFSRAAVFAGATLTGCWTSSPAATETTTTTTTTKQPDAAPGRLEGILASPEGFPDGVEVVLSGPGGDHHATTGANGTFVFDNLAPGDYTLSGNGEQTRVHITSGQNPRIQLGSTEQGNHRGHRAPNMPYGAPPARYRVV